jgi:hypothetical protein
MISVNKAQYQSVDVQGVFDRAAALEQMNQQKLDKLNNPGFLRGVWDKVTFQSKKREKEADTLKQANQIIQQMLEMISRAYAGESR